MKRILPLAFILALLASFFRNDIGGYLKKISQTEIEEAEIVSVIDGDTITVNLLAGDQPKIKTVRLLEIDAPESVHPDAKRNTKYGRLASEHLKEKLKKGDVVYLTADQTDKDRYGRILRLVWLERPKDPYNNQELRSECLNAILLSEGYAQVWISEGGAYSFLFSQLQMEAEKSGKGLWGKGWLGRFKNDER